MPFSRSSVAGRLSLAEPQVPANAVPEAQAVSQNDPPPDAAQGEAIPTAQAQADEISLEVCKVLFSLFFAVFRSGLHVFGLFRFHGSVLFCSPCL